MGLWGEGLVVLGQSNQKTKISRLMTPLLSLLSFPVVVTSVCRMSLLLVKSRMYRYGAGKGKGGGLRQPNFDREPFYGGGRGSRMTAPAWQTRDQGKGYGFGSFDRETRQYDHDPSICSIDDGSDFC